MKLIGRALRTLTTTASGRVWLPKVVGLPEGMDSTNPRTNASTARRTGSLPGWSSRIPLPRVLARWSTSTAAYRYSVAELKSTVPIIPARSEEHTSELQSRGHLVCRLLLEKKKKKSDYNVDSS